jgi:phosphoribosyl-AMP cyclohydrolase
MNEGNLGSTHQPTKAEAEVSQHLTPRFDDQGLIPCIVQDANSGEVLMFAFMNAEALQLTIETQLAHYYSRSRGKLWKKGESSGHTQKVMALRVDCDQDVLLLKVVQEGAACHTGYRSCFYRELDLGDRAPRRLTITEADRAFDPGIVYGPK